MSKDYKKVGKFLYAISDDGKEVTVACEAVLSNLAGQLAVTDQLQGVLTPTGMYQDVHYNGFIYVGVIYQNNIPENELVAALSASK